MAIEDDISLLERVPTLGLLGRQALRILAIGAETRYVHGGELLFKAGDEADGGFVIQEGRFALSSPAEGNEVTVGPVYNIDDAVEDPHFRERAIIVEAQDADLGAIPMHNIVPRLSATPGVWRRPAPALGEHTDEILKEAGYDAAGISALRKSKAAA